MLRPVTEAPRDGTRVLIFFYSPESLDCYWPDAVTVVCGEFGEDRWGFDGYPSSLRYPASNVAGWMPIPDRAAPDLAAIALRQAEEIERLRGALIYLERQAQNGTLHPQVVIQNARAALASTEATTMTLTTTGALAAERDAATTAGLAVTRSPAAPTTS